MDSFYSKFENSEWIKALILEKSLFFKLRTFEKKLFLGTLFLFLFLFFIFKNVKFLGFFLISLSFFLISFLKNIFFEMKIKNPVSKEEILNQIDFEIAKAIYESLNFVKSKKINSSIFLYFLLDEKNPRVRFIFSRLALPLKEIKTKLIEDKREEDELESLILEFHKQKKSINLGEILFFLSKKNNILKKFLIDYDIKSEDFLEVFNWYSYFEKEFLEAKKFWKWKNLLKHGVLAREWTAGYTILLDRFSFDLTNFVKKQKFKKIFVHQKEIETLELLLTSPEKNNVLIVGEPGSGRKSIIEELARRSALGESLPELNFKRVVILDLPRIIAETKSIEEAEILLEKIFNEVVLAENVILVIENFHDYVGIKEGREIGKIEISGILGPYLSSPKFPLIAITTFEQLHKTLELKSELLGKFEKIEVKEVSKNEVLKVLEERVLRLENKYKVFFTFSAIKSTIEFCDSFLPALFFPEKAIEVIDELAVEAAAKKQKIIKKEDVEKIIERKTEIPIGELERAEKEKLLNLEKLLHQRIINQEEAIKEISEALRRARVEIKIRKGPMGVFLFLGPTGVGKTETAKALAQIYFGSEEKMIRLDMSEFKSIEDISKLIGKPGEEGLLTTPVRENPFSLILLDEFEKTHPEILNLFLHVFDEGYLTDGIGRKVNFKNTIIIATSNAGYEVILEILKQLKEGTPLPSLYKEEVGNLIEVWDVVKKRILDFILTKGIFRPELINRFDAVVVFRPLSKTHLLEIAELQLKKIKKQLKEKYNVEFEITEELKQKIVDLGYDITFGARHLNRIVQEKVGNILAKAILVGNIKKGQKIEIDPEKFEIIIKQ